MTKRLRRTSHFEVSVHVTNDNFLGTARPGLRNWILNQATSELAMDLTAAHELSSQFVRGHNFTALPDRTQQELTDAEIMEDWQIPVMREMARTVCAARGDILEVGFGRGIASEFIQEFQPRSHTIVECNDSIVERFQQWRSEHSESDIRLLHGLWQDVAADFAQYDGMLFHTYPLDQDELIQHMSNSVTFAEPFFSVASRHLNPGGKFMYFTNEVDSISRAHQRLLFRHFSEYSARLITDLEIPDNTRDALWARSLVLVTAIR